MNRSVKTFEELTGALTTDRDPDLICECKKLNHNLIEQDQRHSQRHFVKSARFQNLRHASRTLKEIETKRFMLYTNKRKDTLQTSLFRCTRNYSDYSESLKQ